MILILILSEVEILVWQARASIVNELIHFVGLRWLKQTLDLLCPLNFILEELGVWPLIYLGLLATERVHVKLIRVCIAMLNIPINILKKGYSITFLFMLHDTLCLVNR